MDPVPFIPHTDSLLAVIGTGIAVHLIFKKIEAHDPRISLPLILGVPLALSGLYLPHVASFSKAALIAFPLFWTSTLTSIALYRLSPWHPLAKYPGPILCKLSKFYLAFMSTGGKQHLYYAQLHEKYGDAVRVGPNEIVIRDVNAVASILGNNGLPKGPFWDGRVPEDQIVKPLIAIRDKTEHTRRRRPWTRALSTTALKDYEDLVIKRVNQLIEALATQPSPVDLTKWISYFAYDTMSDLAGGTEMMAQGDASSLWLLLEAGQKNAIFMGQVPWLGKLYLRYPKFAEDLKAFRAYAKNRAMIRRKGTSPHKDIFHYLMDEDNVASIPPTPEEIISDGGLAIIAGSDTTSSAITHLFYFLMTHPTNYNRLQKEIDDNSDNLQDGTKQAHMPYLNAVINEALRLYPPVLSGSQRTPDEGSGGKMLGSYFLPEGNNVFLSTYSLHRDPRCFSPLPDTFLPERWLAEQQRVELEPKIFSNANEYIHNTAAFIPFSQGPTNCAGKNLAYLEMRMAVCLIMNRLEVKLQEGYNPQRWNDDMLDYFVTKKGVLPIVVTARQPEKF
ncbi:cytochrome P450 [Gymnopilus junonius]|uniref:Cytochrome P450 n=1 Tax=Gymnopilus junonius TaxID=109634 RepID=A0A9P5NP47_GYMJU|nr:cytochrome P450 [Gymnopilus junonius]